MISSQPKSRQQLRHEKKVEKKSADKLESTESAVATKIKNLLSRAFSERQLNEIAKETNFFCRERKLSSYVIVSILLMGCLNGGEEVSSLETMCCFLRKWFNIFIKPQSLQERINSKECADFIKKVSIVIMIHEANRVISKLMSVQKNSNTKLFKRILLQDSTVISLPDTVSRIFRGCGGSASKAGVKCDIILDQKNHLILKYKCTSSRIPDSSFSSEILSIAEENDLVIRDMGYFNLSHFTIMNGKRVKFISRLKIGVLIYLKENDKEPVDIIEYLKSFGRNKKIDLDVYVGKKERIQLRLIGIKVPEDVVNSRKDQYKKSRGNRKPSNDLLIWYGYTLMITNIPRTVASLKLILKLYKIRWQIELFFKNMKSQLKVDNFTGENKYRILCLFYSKLTLTWIASFLYVLAQAIIGKKYIISQVKFTKWLYNLGDWQKTIAEGDFTELMAAYKRDCDLLQKKGKRKMSAKNRRVRRK